MRAYVGERRNSQPASIAITFKSRNCRYLAGYATTRILRFPGVPGEERVARRIALQDSMGLNRPGSGFTRCPRSFMIQTGSVRSYVGAVPAQGAARTSRRGAPRCEALLEFSPASFVPRSGGESVSFEQLLKLARDAESEHNSRVEQEREARRRRAGSALRSHTLPPMLRRKSREEGGRGSLGGRRWPGAGTYMSTSRAALLCRIHSCGMWLSRT